MDRRKEMNSITITKVLGIIITIAGISFALMICVAVVIVTLQTSGLSPNLGPPPWLFFWLAANVCIVIVSGIPLVIIEIWKT